MRPQSYVTNPLGWIEPLGLSNSSILDKAMEGQVGDKLSAHYVIPREKGAAIKREGSAFTSRECLTIKPLRNGEFLGSI